MIDVSSETRTLPQGNGYWLPEDAHLQLYEIREQLAFFGQLIERRPDAVGPSSRC